MKKAQYFIRCRELVTNTVQELRPENVRRLLMPTSRRRRDPGPTLFDMITPPELPTQRTPAAISSPMTHALIAPAP